MDIGLKEMCQNIERLKNNTSIDYNLQKSFFFCVKIKMNNALKVLTIMSILQSNDRNYQFVRKEVNIEEKGHIPTFIEEEEEVIKASPCGYQLLIHNEPRELYWIYYNSFEYYSYDYNDTPMLGNEYIYIINGEVRRIYHYYDALLFSNVDDSSEEIINGTYNNTDNLYVILTNKKLYHITRNNNGSHIQNPVNLDGIDIKDIELIPYGLILANKNSIYRIDNNHALRYIDENDNEYWRNVLSAGVHSGGAQIITVMPDSNGELIMIYQELHNSIWVYMDSHGFSTDFEGTITNVLPSKDGFHITTTNGFYHIFEHTITEYVFKENGEVVDSNDFYMWDSVNRIIAKDCMIHGKV